MILHIPIQIQEALKHIAVNGKIKCDHDNYTIEVDEYLTHPDDPCDGQTVRYAVCEQCGIQGTIIKNKYGVETIDWGQND